MRIEIRYDPSAVVETDGMEPYILRAIEKLGTFDVNYVAWLWAGFKQASQKGHMGREMRKIGTPLTEEQRAIIHFEDKYEPLTLEACAALNDIGIVNPVEAYDNFTQLVWRTYTYEAKLVRFAHTADRRPWIRHLAHIRCCKAGRSINGLVVPYADMKHLPLKACTLPSCMCDIQQLSDADRKRYGV